jgi:serine phosphatase RsbU (regulator of sigma subunit)
VIAAISASLPETAVVGAFCIVLALLSILWSEGIGGGQRLVALTSVSAGTLAGLWVASLRLRLNREQAASELLADAGALMEDALDQKQRARHLSDLAVNGLGDVAMVDMVMPDGSIQRMAASGRDSEVADIFLKLRADAPIDPHGPHPVAEVIRTGRTLYLDQLSDEDIDGITTRENERQLLRNHRFKSCIVLPLGARGSVLGALTLWIMRPPKAFDETARRTAKRLADRAALALDNARLHEQQAHIASVLQHSLLPRSLPEIQGFEASSRFLAAGEAYEVGGDFYDVFRSGSGTWTAVIGDVCGKGPEAASLTALARYTIRTAASPDHTPSDILRTLHDSISAEHADMRFCTAALARIQTPSNGRGSANLTVSLGGHPLPLILRKNGRVDAVGEPGTLLGALPSPVLADVDAQLAVGDSLILYTDGMLDVGDRSIRDDPAWLEKELGTAAGKNADEIAEQLSQAAIKRHGGEPRDDIAVLVLHRHGGG